MSKKRRYTALLFTTALLTIYSCGIEDYKYLQPIDSGNISRELNTQATIRLPYIDAGDKGAYYYFQNFIIYYRIYISETSIQGQISTDQLQTINAGLYNDYWYLNPYTTLDNNRSPSAMGSVFSSRRFYPLEVEGNVSLDSVLGTGALPPQGSTKRLDLDFAQQGGGTIPSITINNTVYKLQRHYDPAVNVPWPSDRYFINSVDLQDPSKASTTDHTNMDVQNKEGSSGIKYAYAAMYILLFGRTKDLTPVYSAPTFIGIFRLPD
jgi:hypothetical protein